MKPKLLIVGHAQHGKDTVCEILRDEHGFTFAGSSRFCSQLFIFDRLKAKYGYATEEECYADRHNHRAEWFDLISEFNTPDASRLGQEIFSKFDIYCGLRNDREFLAMAERWVFNFSVWVDRSKVVHPEPSSSMKLKQNWMSYTVDNNGTIDELKTNVARLVDRIFWKLP
jgi:hypothetical protein